MSFSTYKILKMNKLFKPLWALLLLAVSAPLAVAQEAEAAVSNIDSGDTAWMLTATVLVLLMTIPGLSLFYGGLVKSKNILSVLMQCFFITAVMSVLWVICGYSLALNPSGVRKAVPFLKGSAYRYCSVRLRT